MTRKEHEVCESWEVVQDIEGDYWTKMPVTPANPTGVLWTCSASITHTDEPRHFRNVLKTKGHKPFRGFMCVRGGGYKDA